MTEDETDEGCGMWHVGRRTGMDTGLKEASNLKERDN
jgi:hypothetical protein